MLSSLRSYRTLSIVTLLLLRCFTQATPLNRGSACSGTAACHDGSQCMQVELVPVNPRSVHSKVTGFKVCVGALGEVVPIIVNVWDFV